MNPVEVITSVQRRRRWTVHEKQELDTWGQVFTLDKPSNVA